jgi:hypothetical protein
LALSTIARVPLSEDALHVQLVGDLEFGKAVALDNLLPMAVSAARKDGRGWRNLTSQASVAIASTAKHYCLKHHAPPVRSP